jgi:hypothetical protein
MCGIPSDGADTRSERGRVAEGRNLKSRIKLDSLAGCWSRMTLHILRGSDGFPSRASCFRGMFGPGRWKRRRCELEEVKLSAISRQNQGMERGPVWEAVVAVLAKPDQPEGSSSNHAGTCPLAQAHGEQGCSDAPPGPTCGSGFPHKSGQGATAAGLHLDAIGDQTSDINPEF